MAALHTQPEVVIETGVAHGVTSRIVLEALSQNEMEQAASVMSPGGVMLVDDIGAHDGFATFARSHSGCKTIICPSDDRIGIFGIAVNTGAR